MNMEGVEKVAQLLQSYAWRDKILRTLTFACNLVAARLSGTKLATRFSLFGAALGRTRAMNRFLDDIPMLSVTLGSGLGNKVRLTLDMLSILRKYFELISAASAL